MSRPQPPGRGVEVGKDRNQGRPLVRDSSTDEGEERHRKRLGKGSPETERTEDRGGDRRVGRRSVSQIGADETRTVNRVSRLIRVPDRNVSSVKLPPFTCSFGSMLNKWVGFRITGGTAMGVGTSDVRCVIGLTRTILPPVLYSEKTSWGSGGGTEDHSLLFGYRNDTGCSGTH